MPRAVDVEEELEKERQYIESIVKVNKRWSNTAILLRRRIQSYTHISMSGHWGGSEDGRKRKATTHLIATPRLDSLENAEFQC
jgi:hypothetical protein